MVENWKYIGVQANSLNRFSVNDPLILVAVAVSECRVPKTKQQAIIGLHIRVNSVGLLFEEDA